MTTVLFQDKLKFEAASMKTVSDAQKSESLETETPQSNLNAGAINRKPEGDTSRFTEAEKKLFPGLTGLVSPQLQEEPKGGVPKSILQGIERMHASNSKDAPAEDLSLVQLAGNEKGMRPAEQGMRVKLAPRCKGNAVGGENGVGTVMWVGNQGQVCHVRWDGTTRFDYSYCIGHNGFFDLCVASNGTDTPATPTGNPEKWTVGQVSLFVEGLRKTFGEKADIYVKAFAREDIDGVTLLKLTKDELQELGLSLGHRKLLLDEISQLQAKHKSDAVPAFSGKIVERAPLLPFATNSATSGDDRPRSEADLLVRQMEAERVPGLQRLHIPGQSDESRHMAELYGGVRPSAENMGGYGDADNSDTEGNKAGDSNMSVFRRRMLAAKRAGQSAV